MEIETWFQEEGRIAACRNWLIRDAASGQQLGQGTRWVAKQADLCSSVQLSPRHSSQQCQVQTQTPSSSSDLDSFASSAWDLTVRWRCHGLRGNQICTAAVT